jgi:hypothetical protein
MAKTKITWDTSNTETGTHTVDLQDQLKTLVDAGKTDGVPVITENGSISTVERTWIDTESAQAWIDLLKSEGGPLVDAIIE